MGTRRVYGSIVEEHLAQQRRMVFVSGPRQVGKTTICRGRADLYLDWDNEDHRAVVLEGPEAVARRAGLEGLVARAPVIAFHELHRYRHWRGFLKGFLDTYEQQSRVLVTASSRLDQYRRSGDSLMGRCFPLRMHPFSVAELTAPLLPAQPVRPPAALVDADWQALWDHGGFPEPFTRRATAFTTRWRNRRRTQLLREDVRDLTRIQELDQFDMLERLLTDRSGEQLVYSSLAREVRVSENTIRSWIGTLCSLHHGFVVRPWSMNLANALRKEPRWYLRDWSGVADPGKRFATLCACHLLKAVEGWTDLGLGEFELRYIRDRQGREVDFVVVRNGRPWFLAEAKLSDTRIAPALRSYHEKTGALHAFQIVAELPFVDADAFAPAGPLVVPARTLLSQLL